MDQTRFSLNSEIVRLKRGDNPNVLKILLRSFADDPMFRYMFSDEERTKYLRDFFDFLCCKSFLSQEMMIGIKHNHILKGVANIELPTCKKSSKLIFNPVFLYESLRLLCRIPLRSFAFINQYMHLTPKLDLSNLITT